MSRITDLACALQTTFSSCAEQANEQVCVVRRKRKFTPVTLASSFILGLLAKPNANGEDFSLIASDLGVEVSPQAVEQRYSAALTDFFRLMFTKMLQIVFRSDESLAPILERFSEVTLLDSSSIQLPDCMKEEFASSGGRGSGGESVMKLQTEMDLRSGQIKCVELEPGKSNDQGCNRQRVGFLKGALRIADLGYFSVAVFKLIDAAQSYFLSRMQHTVKIYVDQQKQTLIPWLNSQECGVLDRTIELGATHRFSCRLIAYRVPEEIASRRRAKARTTSIDKTGRQPTQASLEACDWEFLVTNLTEEQLTVKEAIVLYRARWQIELLFKRWKSHCQINRLDGRNDTMKMARFWIRLCGALVQHWLIVAIGWSADRTLSFEKLAKLIPEIISELASNLFDLNAIRKVILKLENRARIRCKRTTRRNKPGTIEQLRDVQILDFVLT